MEQKYYSIKDFAEKVGVSQQGIYKRLKKENDPLLKYTKLVDNKTVISASAIADIFKKDIPLHEEEKEESQFDNTITVLTEQIAILKSVIDSKDKEIEYLSNQITKLTQMLENQQIITDQQQKLHILEKQEVLLLEAKINKKKKGFFSWFSRKDKEEPAEEVIENE